MLRSLYRMYHLATGGTDALFVSIAGVCLGTLIAEAMIEDMQETYIDESLYSVETLSNKTYFTITGTKFYSGQDFLKPNMNVKLVKDPDNEYDSDAIRVDMDGFGQIGFVANSSNTILSKSISVSCLQDYMGDTAEGVVKLVFPYGVLCELI